MDSQIWCMVLQSNNLFIYFLGQIFACVRTFSSFLVSHKFANENPFLNRMITALTYKRNILRLDDLVAFLIPMAMYVFGKSELASVLRMWLFIIFMGSLIFGTIGVLAGHHHPENAHEGDELP